MKAAVVIIPENLVSGGRLDFYYNGVDPITILHALDALRDIVGQQMYATASSAIGTDDEQLIHEYLEQQLAEYKRVADGGEHFNVNQN